MFLVYAFGLILMSLWWWRRVDVRLKSLRRAALWRTLLAMFIASTVVFPLSANKLGHFYPPILPSIGFLWHVLMVLPAFAFITLLDIAAAYRRHHPKPQIDLSRRNFLTALTAAAPPLITVGLAVEGIHQIGDFTVHPREITIDTMPRELDGFTIAFVADIHTGPFSTSKMLADIVQRTNTIHNGHPADLVVLGGDLINTTLRDLPAGLEMATALRGRLGTVACIGNHDVMDDEASFIRQVRAAGIPVLRDEAMTMEFAPGVRFQILGVAWQIGDPALFQSVIATAAQRDRNLFPICLAHHPHCWDEAVRQNLPLVLSAHTHGGQIMLTDHIGAGPLKFRYWTGVHHRGNSTLVISNGVGNWFPLRVNAPAEIVKLTLRAPTRI